MRFTMFFVQILTSFACTRIYNAKANLFSQYFLTGNQHEINIFWFSQIRCFPIWIQTPSQMIFQPSKSQPNHLLRSQLDPVHICSNPMSRLKCGTTPHLWPVAKSFSPVIGGFPPLFIGFLHVSSFHINHQKASKYQIPLETLIRVSKMFQPSFWWCPKGAGGRPGLSMSGNRAKPCCGPP